MLVGQCWHMSGAVTDVYGLIIGQMMTNAGETKALRDKHSQCHFVIHKFHMDSPGTDPVTASTIFSAV